MGWTCIDMSDEKAWRGHGKGIVTSVRAMRMWRDVSAWRSG